MFACWHASLQAKTHKQNELSVTNQTEYTGLRQIPIFRLFVGCFSAPEPKAQVNYCDHALSVVRLSVVIFFTFSTSPLKPQNGIQ